MSSGFRPWLLDLKIAGLTGVIAAAAAGSLWAWPNGSWSSFSLSLSIVFGLGAVVFFRRFARRWHGQVIEGRAQRSLAKRLGEGWTLQCNQALPIGGDLDGLLRHEGGQSFALEIKSKASFSVVKGRFWSEDSLVDSKGIPMSSGPFVQAIQNAACVQAVPVLWFPDARTKGFSKCIQGVVVICGPANYFLKSLGIPSKSWW